jgi:hypothetical protein
LCLYWISSAPGLTWAHDWADGGDLLAAAVVNGVPHPTGYPFYTLLLRGWLWFGQLANPQIENAYWGNRLSALCVAGAVAFLIATVAVLLYPLAHRWLWAMLAGLAFAVTPLAWSQAVITEVYGLHILLAAALGWAVLTQPPQPHDPAVQPSPRRLIVTDITTGCVMGLALAHHLTSLLLWPALLYWRCCHRPRTTWVNVGLRMIGSALLVAFFFYALLVWRVATAAQPLAVAWGYPRTLSGLWWLVSGAAYRGYLFAMTPAQYAGRLAALARLLVEQFTPIGVIFVIVGLAAWDRSRPYLRNGALLWILPISLYAAGYNTVDSYVYLLPVTWLLCVMLGEGLAWTSVWLGRVTPSLKFRATPLLATAALIGVVTLLFWRFPQNDLRQDHEAQDFLKAAASTFSPGSLIISSADAPTFALWYGQWGSGLINAKDEGGTGNGTLAQTVPGLVFVNFALYQFDWYRNLMHDLYPTIPNMGASFDQLIESNRSVRPIYFTERLSDTPLIEMTPVGKFWRLDPPQ